MWITAWILVASAALYQPTYPPFYTQAECDTARRVYLKYRATDAAECIQVKIWMPRQP